MKYMFLVITSNKTEKTSTWAEREKYVHDFYFGLEERVENIKVVYTTYDDIETTVLNNKVTMRDTRHDVDLADVNLVHFKNWMFDNEHAAMIAFYLNKNGVNFFNSEVDAGLAWGKISQMCRLAYGGVPVPDTFFAKKPRLLSIFENNGLPKGFDFPLIMKADDGAKGNDNHLVKTLPEAIEILKNAGTEKEFVLQNFLPNDGDYRLLFIGLDEPPLVFLRKAVEGSHLNNTSKGGSGSFINPRDVSNEFVRIARQAAEILKREISGVDILVDKTTDKPYVLEVNSTPALATGYGVEEKQAKFADFLQRSIDMQEDE